MHAAKFQLDMFDFDVCHSIFIAHIATQTISTLLFRVFSALWSCHVVLLMIEIKIRWALLENFVYFLLLGLIFLFFVLFFPSFFSSPFSV
jgi:hypothetical protein